MKPKKLHQTKLTEAELQLIERLRQHPELAERFGSILEITATADGRLKRAGDIEELLMEELRRLGTATMEGWASRAEQILQKEYAQPFRALPPAGAQYVVAEADGSLVCTVAPGTRKGKRPRDWKEIRLAAAQTVGKAETFYAATFGDVQEAGRRGRARLCQLNSTNDLGGAFGSMDHDW